VAGYSGTPLPRKLGIKPACAVAVLGAPRVGSPPRIRVTIAAIVLLWLE
jgi:hypothetical protein